MRNPNRYDFIWIKQNLALQAAEYPFEDLTIFSAIVGRHFIEVTYAHGYWWVSDKYPGADGEDELLFDVPFKSPEKAAVRALQRLRQLGFY